MAFLGEIIQLRWHELNALKTHNIVTMSVHINSCENRASLLRPWLSKHRGISKDRLETYLKIFKTYRNLTNKNRRTHKPNSKETTTHNTITMSA